MKLSKKLAVIVVASSVLIVNSTIAFGIRATLYSKAPAVSNSYRTSLDSENLLDIKQSLASLFDKSTNASTGEGVNKNISSAPNSNSVQAENEKNTTLTANNTNNNLTSVKSSTNASTQATVSNNQSSSSGVSTAPSSNNTVPSVKPAPVPNPIPAPPSTPSSSKLILGYATYYSTSDTSSYYSMTGHSSLVNEIATHTYIVDSTGNIYIQGNGPFPTSQVSYANSHGIKTLAVVRNEFSATVASSVLNNAGYKNNLINSILASVKNNNFKGVNIDFEMLKSSDRTVFTNFMRDLYNTLHPQGYIVSIALPAKTSDSESWVYAYDYAALGSYADQVILMTYDEHYPGGAPGPIASTDWVQRIVNYSVTKIPRSKLLLGIAAYGYDWTVSNGKTISTASYSIQTAYSTAANKGVQVLWDSSAQVPYYNYSDSKGNHSVYFENSTSIGYKLNIVNNSNLLGAAIWRLGLEDDSYWTTIRTKLR